MKIYYKLLIFLSIVIAIYILYWNFTRQTQLKNYFYFHDTGSINSSYTIARFIHQSWKTKTVPEFFVTLTRSWTETCFKKWEYKFYSDEDNLNMIKTKFPWFLNTYNKLPGAIFKADVCRYFYLYEYGGIYSDIDNECLRPFEHLLAPYAIVFGAMKGQHGGTKLKEGYVQNSFMYSRPKQKFWMDLILSIQSRMSIFNRDSPEMLTGPIILTNFIDNLKKNRPLDMEYLKIYPPSYFNPFSWKYKQESPEECKDFNRMTAAERDICRKYFYRQNSYVVQYHAHTWG